MKLLIVSNNWQFAHGAELGEKMGQFSAQINTPPHATLKLNHMKKYACRKFVSCRPYVLGK